MVDIKALQQNTDRLLDECDQRLTVLEKTRLRGGAEVNESRLVNQSEQNKPGQAAAEDSNKQNSRNRAKNRAANQAAVQMLIDTYPLTFSRDQVKPLKIGIQEDLIADEKLARNRIKRALASYVRGIQYLKSMQVGADRVGLDGQAAGTVTEAEAEHAQTKLKQIQEQRQAARKEARKAERQAERKAQRDAKEQRMTQKLDQLLQLNKR